MVIRRSACHDPAAGCYKFPAEPLDEGSKQLVEDLSKRVTWARPLKGNESPEEAYARGWADAIKSYEQNQEHEKSKTFLRKWFESHA